MFRKNPSDVTKTSLSRAVHDEIGVHKPLTKALIRTVFDQIGASLALGNDVVIPNFGAFRLAVRSAKVGRHPVTGDPISIPPRVAVVFRPSKALSERVE